MRINGEVDIPKMNLPQGLSRIFEWSSDGINWNEVKGGKIDLDSDPQLMGNLEIYILVLLTKLLCKNNSLGLD